MSGKATNRGGDGLELVPHLRGVPLPSPRQSALLTITFNQTFTQWALEGLYEYCGHRSLTSASGVAEVQPRAGHSAGKSSTGVNYEWER